MQSELDMVIWSSAAGTCTVLPDLFHVPFFGVPAHLSSELCALPILHSSRVTIQSQFLAQVVFHSTTVGARRQIRQEKRSRRRRRTVAGIQYHPTLVIDFEEEKYAGPIL